MVMVAVGVYARLMKHAGGLQVSLLPLHNLLAPALALGGGQRSSSLNPV